MWKTRIVALLILAAGVLLGLFVYASETGNKTLSKYKFKLGLDLSGGTHLIYRADVKNVPSSDITDSMNSLRDVIERRVNLFGIAEPTVQVENASFTNGGEHRIIVDLPGVTDINQAVTMIGQTPLLEFKTERDVKDPIPVSVSKDGVAKIDPFEAKYTTSPLTGRYLKKAMLEFDPQTREPHVTLQFNDEGSKLFEDITRANVGKTVAIFLDGAPISTPVVREAISGGKAVISGNFTPNEAKQLVGRLNSGALPVPIELISTQTIGASLGEKAVHDGVRAGLIGFIAIALFLLVWYRLPGLISVISLSIYATIMLSLIKYIPITLTAAGIAGFIISLGTAVDGNILIFERIKEEIKGGKDIASAIKAGFDRAWFSIRDANLASLISGIILFAFGTPLIKGFALTLTIGMIVSLFSAILVSRAFLYALRISKTTKLTRFLFGSGISNATTMNQ